MSSKKFSWADRFASILKRCYRTAHNRNELIRNLNHIQGLTESDAITSHTSALGIAKIKKRSWTAADIYWLRELAGTCGRSTLRRYRNSKDLSLME